MDVGYYGVLALLLSGMAQADVVLVTKEAGNWAQCPSGYVLTGCSASVPNGFIKGVQFNATTNPTACFTTAVDGYNIIIQALCAKVCN
jgi:hypothetical protein